MAARIIDGKTLAAQVKARVRDGVEDCKRQGVEPCLAVLLVGDDPASAVYVRGKARDCEECGIRSLVERLPANTTQEALLVRLAQLAADDSVHGILVQLPLPAGLDEAAALARIAPEKDVDGFHVVNAGKLFTGQKGVVACTPKGAMEMIRRTGIDLSGKEAVVVGRSNIVGKPMAMLLLQQNATVTMCHSRTQHLAEHTRRADVLVAAVGKPRFITADMVKPGAIVIDVGINRVDGKVVGDVDFDAVKEVASWITPVPGGVGRMTITMLLENTIEAAERTVK